MTVMTQLQVWKALRIQVPQSRLHLWQIRMNFELECLAFLLQQLTSLRPNFQARVSAQVDLARCMCEPTLLHQGLPFLPNQAGQGMDPHQKHRHMGLDTWQMLLLKELHLVRQVEDPGHLLQKGWDLTPPTAEQDCQVECQVQDHLEEPHHMEEPHLQVRKVQDLYQQNLKYRHT